jgi:hypothetical protein
LELSTETKETAVTENLSPEDARKKKMEARAQFLYSNAMSIREKKAQAEKDAELGIKRGRFGEIIGETTETPDMVRWVSGGSHYFLKHTSPGRPIFALGLEHRIGDLAYIFDTSIEFDNDEAPDLMDRIAAFNDLPTYTELVKSVAAINALVKDLERTDRPEDRHILNRLRAILEDDQNG